MAVAGLGVALRGDLAELAPTVPAAAGRGRGLAGADARAAAGLAAPGVFEAVRAAGAATTGAEADAARLGAAADLAGAADFGAADFGARSRSPSRVASISCRR